MKTFSCLGVLLLLACLVAPARASANADITGEWSVEFSTGTGDVHNEDDMQMYISQDGSRLTGHIEWNSSPTDYPLKGTISGDQFQIVWTTNVNGAMSAITFRGTVKADEINGTVDIPGHETGELYARRTGR